MSDKPFPFDMVEAREREGRAHLRARLALTDEIDGLRDRLKVDSAIVEMLYRGHVAWFCTDWAVAQLGDPKLRRAVAERLATLDKTPAVKGASE